MKRTASLLGILLATIALPCMWDNDTLYEELHGKPDLQNAIVGRLDINPPEYYEFRIRLMKDQLAKNPKDLNAYDNISVAYSRLSKHDEAIRWILEKRNHLAGASKDAHYRTEANEGTFRLVKWMVAGAPASQIAEGLKAREMIRKAIKINPDAHFGREKAQLLVMDWLIGIRQGKINYSLAIYVQQRRKEFEDRDPYKGISGLIQLGAAANSVDIVGSLTGVTGRDSHIDMLAKLRVEELWANGQRSFLQNVKPEDLYAVDYQPMKPEKVKAEFAKFRADAKKYLAARNAYARSKLEEGQHPDNSSDFWEGFSPPAQPYATKPTSRELFNRYVSNPLFIMITTAIVLIGLVATLVFIVRRAMRRREEREEMEWEIDLD